MAEKHQRDWKAAITPAILLLIVVGFYWRITLTGQYTWLDNPDGVFQVLPWMQVQASAVHQGELPLWDPYEWGGQPLIGQMQPGAGYPVNWLLFSLPLRNGFIRHGLLKWYFVVIHFMGALFCYLLCRDLKRSRAASLLAGAAFGLGGWMGSTDWPQMLNSALWTPLLFLFLLRVMRGYRPMASAAFAGACLGVALLAGHHQIPTFAGLAAAGFWIFLAFRNGQLDWRIWRPLLVFGVFVVLIGALQILPAWECGRWSVRWVGTPGDPLGWNKAVPYDVLTGFGLFPLSVLGLAIPGITRNSNPYIGMALLALAFLAVTAAWKERVVRFLGCLALASLLFTLAGFTFFQGLLYAVLPGIDKARNPSAAIFIFHFCIIILGSYALDSYVSLRTSLWLPRLYRFLLGFAMVIYVALLIRTLWSIHGGPDPDGVALAALTAVMLAAALYGWSRGQLTPKTVYVLVFLLALAEIGQFSSTEWRNQDQPGFIFNKIYHDGDVAAFIRQQKGPVRLEIDSTVIPYNFGDWYGMEVFGGYLASLTANVYRAQGHYNARMLAGVNLYVGDKPLRPNQSQIYENARGIRVYTNPEAMPSAWSVHQVKTLGGPDEISKELDEPLDQLRSRAFVTGPVPPLGTCLGADQVQVAGRRLNSLSIAATMQCKGMVVVGDTYYPGWQATVDGRDAPIYEVYGFLRGVLVDSGQHRIEMRYRPRSVFWGAALTAIGFLGVIAVWVGGRRPSTRFRG